MSWRRRRRAGVASSAGELAGLVARDGCPLCGVLAQAEDRWFFWFVAESYSFPELTGQLRASLGLCPAHTRRLLASTAPVNVVRDLGDLAEVDAKAGATTARVHAALWQAELERFAAALDGGSPRPALPGGCGTSHARGGHTRDPPPASARAAEPRSRCVTRSARAPRRSRTPAACCGTSHRARLAGRSERSRTARPRCCAPASAT